MNQAISPKGRGLVCPVRMHQQELRVLRSTLTLKTTNTTLASVAGNNGQLGAPVLLLCAYPETITEVTPGATVTRAQSLGIPRMWEAWSSVVTELKTQVLA